MDPPLLPHSAIHDPDDLQLDLQLLSPFAYAYTSFKRELYQSAQPFPHIVIDDFFEQEIADALYQEFPDESSKRWHRYNNPIEYKLAMNELHKLPAYGARVMMMLNHWSFLRWVKEVTGIDNLEADPYLHGAGLHLMPAPGGKLDMHLDYSLHPITGKERRVNLIVYLNKELEGGNLELWDPEMKSCVEQVEPSFNKAILFSTSDISWHGMPEPLKGDTPRKSLAVYYVSPPRDNVVHRPKAKFVGRPGDPESEILTMVRGIRSERRLTAEDLKEWPEGQQRLQQLGCVLPPY